MDPVYGPGRVLVGSIWSHVRVLVGGLEATSPPYTAAPPLAVVPVLGCGSVYMSKWDGYLNLGYFYSGKQGGTHDSRYLAVPGRTWQYRDL